MIPVHQTVFGNGKGNCFAAVIASILELPLEEVPNFCGDYGDAWWEKTQEWLVLRGLYGIEFTLHPEQIQSGFVLPFPSEARFIATGKSPRGEFHHCVVAKLEQERFQGVHDPHPSGDFLDGPILAVMFFATLEPAKQRLPCR